MWKAGTGKRGKKEHGWGHLCYGSVDVCLLRTVIGAFLLGAASLGCSPRVKIEAPEKPIEINVNVKIEQEVKIKLDKAVERTLTDNPELFGMETRP